MTLKFDIRQGDDNTNVSQVIMSYIPRKYYIV